MHLDVRTEEGFVRFDLNGRLDSVAAPAFEEAVLGRLAAGPLDALFHLPELSYISSSGLRVFLQAAKTARTQGTRIVLAGMRPQVREIFDLAGFTPFFTLADDLESALAALRQGE